MSKNIIEPKISSIFSDQIIAGFTTASLGNFALTRKSISSKVSNRENRENLATLLDIDAQRIFAPLQTHSDIVIDVTEDKAGLGSMDKTNAVEGDAALTDCNNIPILTSWADCVPVIFYDHVKNVIANAHSGWKGTKLNIVQKVLDNFITKGSSLKDIYIAIGPSIHACCYEVNDDFKANFPGDEYAFQNRNGKLYFDVASVIYQRLLENGINSEKIEFIEYCTYCCKEYSFSSFRRDKDNFEGQAAFIMLK